MKVGDTVQTINAFIPVTGEIVKFNLNGKVVVHDNDPLAYYEFKEYDTEDVEVVS